MLSKYGTLIHVYFFGDSHKFAIVHLNNRDFVWAVNHVETKHCSSWISIIHQFLFSDSVLSCQQDPWSAIVIVHFYTTDNVYTTSSWQEIQNHVSIAVFFCVLLQRNYIC